MCDKEPIKCQIVVERGRGFTFCQFSQITADSYDLSKIKIVPTLFQGRLIDSNQVTAIAISSSDFDHIPSSIFTNFGDVFKLKFNGGSLKVIQKESFATATHLRYFEVSDAKIEKIYSRAFQGADKMEEIKLINCDIGEVAVDAFEGLNSLKRLKLKGSKFSNTDFFENLPESVETIELP